MPALAALPLLSLLLGAGPPAGPGGLNAQGFQLYKKGKTKEAHQFFLRSTREEPKVAFGWLNLARTTVLLEGKKEPEDYCDFASNWVLKSLAYLNQAVELDRRAVLAKLAEKDPALVALQKRPEHARWLTALESLPASDAELEKFLLAHREWYQPGVVARFLTLHEKGRAAMGGVEVEAPNASWSVSGGAVILEGVKHRLKVRPWAFDEGRLSFAQAALLSEKGGEDWLLGPLVDDCG